ncbi:hypothetical protein V3C99_004010 [Haemonchus contortus]
MSSSSRWPLFQLRRLSSAITNGGAMKGRFQQWKKPVYYAPYIHPLERGPDFSHADGRIIHVTSRIQLEYKQDQLRLAKKIVKLLGEIDAMEAAHKQAESRRISEAHEREALRPKSKGTRNIT